MNITQGQKEEKSMHKIHDGEGEIEEKNLGRIWGENKGRLERKQQDGEEKEEKWDGTRWGREEMGAESHCR